MTKEEIIISLGLDNSALFGGSKAAGMFMEESMNKTLKGLKNLFAVNFAQMFGGVEDLWGKTTKAIAEFWYDLEGQIARGTLLENMRRQLHNIMRDLRGARTELENVISARAFREADPDKQWEMLNDQLQIALQAEDEAIRKFKELKAIQDTYRGKNLMPSRAQTLAKSRAEEDMVKAQTKVLQIQEQMDATLKNIETTRKRNLELAVKEANVPPPKMPERPASPLQFNLHDLATNPAMAGTRWGGMAQQAEQLMENARTNSQLGFHQRAKDQMSRADKIFQQLKKENPMLADPQMEIVHTLQRIEKNGLPIKQATKLPKK